MKIAMCMYHKNLYALLHYIHNTPLNSTAAILTELLAANTKYILIKDDFPRSEQ